MIVGGGPGGLSALLWCAELGLNAILLEKERELGGQLKYTFNPIRNHLGIVAGDGQEMCDRFLSQLEGSIDAAHAGAAIVEVNLAEKWALLNDGERVEAKAIIIATGVRRRKLGIPGETEFSGRGILESGAKAKHLVSGKRVLIVGGGDAAIENALILSETAERVFVVHRRNVFTARDEFYSRAVERNNIHFMTDSRVSAITGREAVERALIEDIGSGSKSELEVHQVLIRIGVVPNTELFSGQLDLDASGYIRVSSDCSTGKADIFAIGDVANPQAPTISGAVGQAATAVKAIAAKIRI
ncbi:MAG: NAD(P)/FAD-dependent oxidoreductase [Pyrinomonadaceae bacterium]